MIMRQISPSAFEAVKDIRSPCALQPALHGRAEMDQVARPANVPEHMAVVAERHTILGRISTAILYRRDVMDFAAWMNRAAQARQ